MQLHQYAEALKLYGQLAREFPLLGSLWQEYGRAAAAAGDHELAAQIWETVLTIEPGSAELLLRVSMEYGKIWQLARARELSRQAAELEAGNLNAQVNLASMLARTAGVDEAREAVGRCLQLDPRNEQARYLSAHLDRRENKLAEAEQQFRDLLSSGLQDPDVIYFCHFELARVLDGTERFDEAMTCLRDAKRLASKKLDLGQARKVFDERRERVLRKAQSLPKNTLGAWARAFPPEARKSAPRIAFLGGHARSGTTLLERILDSHPAAAACDESLAFATIGPLVDVTLPEIPVDGLNFVRQRYLNNFLKSLGTEADGKLLIDKNPAVTAYLPAFLRAFPELHVLIALRDPRDVLISCYFEDQVQVSHLSFDRLSELYSSVMGVWLAVREWEGLTWMETRYEDIVTDLPKEGRRVTTFLGLDWHESQARYYEARQDKTILSTNNYNNVTKPVYARSVGRWRAYERYLAPAMPLLEPFCKEFGYS